MTLHCKITLIWDCDIKINVPQFISVSVDKIFISKPNAELFYRTKRPKHAILKTFSSRTNGWNSYNKYLYFLNIPIQYMYRYIARIWAAHNIFGIYYTKLKQLTLCVWISTQILVLLRFYINKKQKCALFGYEHAC